LTAKPLFGAEHKKW